MEKISVKSPIFWVATALLTLCVGVGPAQAAEPFLRVNAGGVTSLSVMAGGNERATVTIEARSVEIGKPSDPVPDKPTTSCTYSRYPCGLVDRIDFAVNGTTVFAARSVFADLADIDSASLSVDDHFFILNLKCGDASEAYNVMIKFNNIQVLERTITLPGSRYILQETKYFPIPSFN